MAPQMTFLERPTSKSAIGNSFGVLILRWFVLELPCLMLRFENDLVRGGHKNPGLYLEVGEKKNSRADLKMPSH